ncbi:trna (5-methylaminomethyl-2-thiouridylate)-methyltransferase [hydrocarbon metagenome]|uniref:Trna (5-methylaminomethyl-2-thiouridylate)-methyltransferase n=1 Tax=hydrocarbon metagenome TaxID=938273 RepID=A0A0W8E7D6_9ZZZZ
MKALSLFSGGLDSQLAVALIKEQGIEIIGLHFTTPFFSGSQDISKAAQDLGIEFMDIDISEDYIPKVLLNPVYGYGKNFNPCIDCHAFMLNTAGKMMEKLGASFMLTGEVVGQRPMSQNRSALNAVDKLSGFKGYVVRPLSGRLMDQTIPERESWIDRKKLLDINGRGRTRQMELAEKYGLRDYPSPAGGCLLTESNFANRLRQMLQFVSEPSARQMEILRLGRHFYLGDGILLVVGRNRSENQRLAEMVLDSDVLLKVADRPGPLAVIRCMKDGLQRHELEYAASIVARYSDAKQEPQAHIKVFSKNEENAEIFGIKPLSSEEVPSSI